MRAHTQERSGGAARSPDTELQPWYGSPATLTSSFGEDEFDDEAMLAEEILSPLEMLALHQDQADRRRRLVRNRWQLFWMLHKNPILQGYRAHAIAMMAARDFEMEARASAAKRDGAVKRYAKKAIQVAGEIVDEFEEVLEAEIESTARLGKNLAAGQDANRALQIS